MPTDDRSWRYRTAAATPTTTMAGVDHQGRPSRRSHPTTPVGPGVPGPPGAGGPSPPPRPTGAGVQPVHDRAVDRRVGSFIEQLCWCVHVVPRPSGTGRRGRQPPVGFVGFPAGTPGGVPVGTPTTRYATDDGPGCRARPTDLRRRTGTGPAGP